MSVINRDQVAGNYEVHVPAWLTGLVIEEINSSGLRCYSILVHY